jgi:hypothetical protein
MKYKKFEFDKLRIEIELDTYDVGKNFPLSKPIENEDIFVQWSVDIDIATGIIQDWTKGESRNLFAKVVDSGSYYLLDKDNNVIAAIEEDYVPNKCIPPDDGYNDYIVLHIDENGKITNWYKKPNFSEVCKKEDE